MPIIRKQKIFLEDIRLIGYDHTKTNDERHMDYWVHFFLDDYKFEAVWNAPEPRISKLRQYRGALSPQFSTYYTMPLAMQIYNTFRSRWCGAYLQSKGICVIPTVTWGQPQSDWFYFDGIEKGSVVAVSTLGVKKEKDFFLRGYREMLRRIEPEAILCYCTPFSEMEGNIIFVDYAQTNHLEPYSKSWLVPIERPGVSNSENFDAVSQSDLYVKKCAGYVISNGYGGGGGGRGRSSRYHKFPGWDPTKSPGPGFEWRGRGSVESGKGNWYNPSTKEWYHSDLGHDEPYGPHWDYNYPGGGNGFRVFPDGTMSPKFYEGAMIYT